jgi:hypothetical protein
MWLDVRGCPHTLAQIAWTLALLGPMMSEMTEPEWDANKWGPPPPPVDHSSSALEQARSERPARPFFLDAYALVSIASWALGLVLGATQGRSGAGIVCGSLLGFAFLYSVWSGRNWARIVTMVLTALSVVLIAVLLLSRFAAQLDALTRIKLASDAIFGVITVIGLNSKAVRDYCIRVSLGH